MDRTFLSRYQHKANVFKLSHNKSIRWICNEPQEIWLKKFQNKKITVFIKIKTIYSNFVKYFTTWYIIWIWTNNILSLRWPQNEFLEKYASKIFQRSYGNSHIFLWQFANIKVGKVIWEKLRQWSFLVLGPMDLRMFRWLTAGRASNTSVVNMKPGFEQVVWVNQSTITICAELYKPDSSR